MSAMIIGGPHDGERWSGRLVPEIRLLDSLSDPRGLRFSHYRLGADGKYHFHATLAGAERIVRHHGDIG